MMQTNIQALHNSMKHHIAYSNNLQELLTYVDEDSRTTPKQHQLIEQAHSALCDCIGTIQVVSGRVS